MCVRIVLAACIVSLHAAPVLAQPATCKSTASGDLRVHQLDSRIFGNTRTLRVWLPPGYGLATNSIPEMIVVGIDHAGARRAHEFLPYKDYANNPDMEEPAAFGGKETDDPVIAEKVIALFRMVEGNFHAAGYDDANFRFRLDPQARHDEVAWAARLPEAMQFLFGEWKAQP